jgi:hypothetical protein
VTPSPAGAAGAKLDSTMTNALRRIGQNLSRLVAEDRPGFKRIDVSPARYDDGSWLDRR